MSNLTDRVVEELMVEARAQAQAKAGEVSDGSLPWLRFDVYMEDGRHWQVRRADQRDMRRANLHCKISDILGDQLGLGRAIAWSYLQRTGELADTWPDFDRGAMFVLQVGPDDDDEEPAADPTVTATAD